MDNSCAPNSIHSVAGAGNNTWPRFPSTLFRSLLTAALLLLAMTANLAHALKLGEAQVRSTQGQWLDIYIPVADAKQLELLDLQIKQIRAADAAGLGFSDAIDDPEYLLDLLSDGRG